MKCWRKETGPVKLSLGLGLFRIMNGRLRNSGRPINKNSKKSTNSNKIYINSQPAPPTFNASPLPITPNTLSSKTNSQPYKPTTPNFSPSSLSPDSQSTHSKNKSPPSKTKKPPSRPNSTVITFKFQKLIT